MARFQAGNDAQANEGTTTWCDTDEYSQLKAAQPVIVYFSNTAVVFDRGRLVIDIGSALDMEQSGVKLLSEDLDMTDHPFKSTIPKEFQLEKLLDMGSVDKVLGDIDTFETEDGQETEFQEIELSTYDGAVLSWCAIW